MGAVSRIRLVQVVSNVDRSGLYTGLVRGIDPERFVLSVVCVGTPDADFARATAEAGVPLEGLGAGGRLTRPVDALRLARRLREGGADVVHAHVFDPTLVAMTAACLARVPVRLHTRHHADLHTRLGRPLHVGLDRAAALASTRVIAVSEHARAHLVDVERVPPSRVVTIPNALDPTRIEGLTPGVIREAGATLPARGAGTILVPGRLHPDKGHRTLFRALQTLRQRGARPPVLLAGEGPFEEAFRAEVEDLGLRDQVFFLGFRRDVVALMASAGLVLVPSSAESFGLAAVEAMAVGAPLVVSDAGGLPEVVRHGRDARLVPRDDPRALADALEDYVRRGTAAVPRPPDRADVLARFGFERFVRRHEVLYEELLREAQGGR